MAVQTSDYLKEKFSDKKLPNGADFSDLIDSCINASVSGGATFVDSVTAEGVFACNNIIVQSEDTAKWKLIVTNSGVVSAVPFLL